LIEVVRQAGVVGAGGAGFPTHVKLDVRGNLDTVIVNGAECEPLLRVDQELIKMHAAELVETLALCVSTIGAKRGVFAVKKKNQAACEALSAAIASASMSTSPPNPIQLAILGDYYPAGDEQLLVYEVTGKAVPEGGLPLHVGAVVVNVETLWNIHQAVKGVPVVDTYVTVTGAVRQPITVRAAIGTPVRELIKAAGGISADGDDGSHVGHGDGDGDNTTNNVAIIHGGPMMGSLLATLDTPVSKLTKGLIVLPGDHPLVRKMKQPATAAFSRAASSCCQCRQCTDLCPRYLLGHSLAPHMMMRAAGYGLIGDTTAWTTAFLCSECGVCEHFACTASLSPRLLYKTVKNRLAAAGVKNPHHDAATPRSAIAEHRVPTSRLIWRLGLTAYDVAAPLVEDLDLLLRPAEVRIPLKQNAGAPATPVVQVGEQVERGRVVAEIPSGALGARHHASISGKVTAINAAGEVVISRD